jgi:hypothetical protein
VFWIRLLKQLFFDIDSEFTILINQLQHEYPKAGNTMVEAEGIIINARVKIETALKKDKAFDKETATGILEYGAVLDIMQKGGLVEKTADGKYYMTKKGQDKQIRGFSLIEPKKRKFVRFSRNK